MGYTEKAEVQGRERENILARAAAKLDQWGLKMPDVFPPVVFDFGLGDFVHSGHIEYWIANELEEHYCGKFLFMFDGQTCLAHHHDKKHETFFILKGKVVMHIKDGDVTMNPGDSLPMPQGTVHSFTAETDSLILEVSLPSLKGDSIFEDERVGTI